MMNNDDDKHVVSYLTLRRWIGILGIGLPWACWIANGTINCLNLLNNPKLVVLGTICLYEPEENLKSSISHFYYTVSGPLFIGIIVTVAIFLFCYKGHKLKSTDRWSWITDGRVTTLAAIAALGIVVFPTDSVDPIPDNLFVFTTTPTIGWIHYISAAVFFIMMAVLCLVNFRRRGNGNFGTGDHDLVYRSCGWIILSSIAIVFIYGFFLKEHLNWKFPVTFIFEAVALTAFGTAWLVKGRIDDALAVKKTAEFIKSIIPS
jgi:hypothetical protein